MVKVDSKKLSRKDKRKNIRNEKKIKKAINYAKNKKAKTVCLDAKNIEWLKKSETNSGLRSQLNGMVLSRNASIVSIEKDKENIKSGKVKGGKKKKKKQSETVAESEDEAFKVTDSTNARLARLQEFVERESQNKQASNGNVKKKSLKPSTEGNLIKDKYKLKELRQGIEDDTKEYKKMCRRLKLRSALKDSACPFYQDEYGDILNDIENNIMPSSSNGMKTDYNSDEEFFNDFHKVSKNVDKKERSDIHSQSSDESSCVSGESEVEEDFEQADDDEEEDSQVSRNVDKIENKDIELQSGDDEAGDEDFEESDNDEEEDLLQDPNNVDKIESEDTEIQSADDNSFLDDEAEEVEDFEESDNDDEENEHELAFEAGSRMNNSQSNPSNLSFNSIFDMYQTESDSEQDDTDLEDFVVDDDFVEYESEDQEEDVLNPAKRKRIDENCKKKFKRILLAEDSVSEEERDNKLKSSEDELQNDSNSNCKLKTSKNIECKHNKSPIIENDLDLQTSDIKQNGILKSSSNISNSSKAKSSKSKKVKATKEKRVSFSLPDDCTNSDEESTRDNSIKFHEDIYGRLRDQSGNVVTNPIENSDQSSKYIPPAMRKLMELNQSDKKKEQLATLKRNLKGLLNRLALSNMAGILKQFETYYQTQSKNDMNETLTLLLFESLILPVLNPERFIQEHALFVATLSANVGTEVGAHILTEFVLRFVDEYEELRSDSQNQADSKNLDNILLFICYLFEFKVVDASLLYDILKEILKDHLEEKQVDLILHVLRSVGFSLRKSNPLALKNLISEIQSKAAEVQADQNLTRTRFMLEILTAIRNNNVSKVPNYDPSHSQHLKTMVKGLIRTGCRSPELKVSLNDIVQSKLVGKWWLVGSAWYGTTEDVKNTVEDVSESSNRHCPVEYSEAFMSKATKLNMTRFPKINILYILCEGSCDFEDAAEKILEMKLPNNQEKEIFDVMLYILVRSKVWTDFYSSLCHRLCSARKGLKRVLRLALKDKFTELDSMKPNHLSNLAKFISQLIIDNVFDLTVIQTVNFVDADEKTVSFLRQVFMGILLSPTGKYGVSQAFSILCSSPKFNSLRQYVRLFITKFISPKGKGQGEDMQILKSRVKLCLNVITSVGGVKL